MTKSKSSALATILVGVAILGVVLSLINYGCNRSLWLDEASLALNIVNTSAYDLMAPLAYNQVAPIGFLLVEKFFAGLFGNTDWSLRLFPLLSFLLSVWLFSALAREVLRSKLLVAFCLAIYSTSYYVIYYSAEVKQYMSDVTICLVITLLTVRGLQRDTSANFWLLALLGGISIWLSNVAVITLFPIGLLLLIQSFKRPKNLKRVVLLLGVWCTSFAIYYSFFIHGHTSRLRMITYWNDAGAFIPGTPLDAGFYLALFKKVLTYFSLAGAENLSLIALPFYGIGTYFLARRQRKLLVLLSGPLVIHIILSYLWLYPFDLRLILYLYPALIILTAIGIEEVLAWLETQTRASLGWVLLCAVGLNLAITSVRGFPVEREEIKKNLTILNDKIQHEETVFVYSGAWRAFQFYREDYPNLTLLPDEDIVVAQSHRSNPFEYGQYLTDMQGPTWLLFSHIYSNTENSKRVSEEAFILKLCKQHQLQLTESHRFKGASLHRVMPDR